VTAPCLARFAFNVLLRRLPYLSTALGSQASPAALDPCLCLFRRDPGAAGLLPIQEFRPSLRTPLFFLIPLRPAAPLPTPGCAGFFGSRGIFWRRPPLVPGVAWPSRPKTRYMRRSPLPFPRSFALGLHCLLSSKPNVLEPDVPRIWSTSPCVFLGEAMLSAFNPCSLLHARPLVLFFEC